MWTIQEIKYLYKLERIEQEFEQYLRDNFIQTYDEQLNFLGYELEVT